MVKIPTLFQRIYENGKVSGCTDVVTSGCEWVLFGDGTATQKLDGTCCLVKDGAIYARFDAKAGRAIPDGAIPCQPNPDPITGHWPHWIKVENQSQYKFHKAAFERQKTLKDGTYELCGIHFQGDPERIGQDTLIKHGEIIIDVPRDFDSIKKYVCTHDIEGIVFHRGNGEMCKIKGSDFGVLRGF